MVILTTFSITGYCPRTGMVGTSVCTALPGVGSLASFGQAGVGAVSTQSFVNPYLGIDSLKLMAQGQSAEEALDAVLAADPGREQRQLAVIDAHGKAAGFTGAQCIDWNGHIVGDGFVAAANMMVDETTTQAMAHAFEANADLPLHDRLLKSLEAGDETGGDYRGRQSASLLVYDKEEYPALHLRVDEHQEPVAELRRVYEVSRTQLLPLLVGMPTRENPLGSLDPDDPALAPLLKHVSER
ncbi:MAG: DUF1028 domain-containing protein [Chloroflexota bacterium]